MKIFLTVLCFSGFLYLPQVVNKNLNAGFEEEERFKREVLAVEEIINSGSSYNKEIAFFIDMRISSGKNRFFVYDLIDKKIVDQGLVAHGSGSETGIRGELKFCNILNSKSTSLGRYYIGKKYKGTFGIAYKLHGLDESNSNAFIRNIVLHYYSAVPTEEQNYNIVNSHGCPMVSELFFKRIEQLINKSNGKVVLNIYY